MSTFPNLLQTTKHFLMSTKQHKVQHNAMTLKLFQFNLEITNNKVSISLCKWSDLREET